MSSPRYRLLGSSSTSALGCASDSGACQHRWRSYNRKERGGLQVVNVTAGVTEASCSFIQ